MFELKPLSSSAIPAALAKAERYRLLNEPEEAESICEDILAAEPHNGDARVTLLLALTDQFTSQSSGLVARAQALAATIESDYERAYYNGLISERSARAVLKRGGPGCSLTAGDWLRDAMAWYERADTLRPPDNDDVRLRWNACVRLFGSHPQLHVTDEERAMPTMLE
ncbi:MAG: hypothetical protein AB7Q29_09670 [Vicinamibacterales bacterium]